MNLLGILIEEVVLVAIISLGLWFKLKRSSDNREIKMRDASLSKEELELRRDYNKNIIQACLF